MSEVGIKIIILYLIIVNVIGFVLMGIDKRKAIRHKWRIPESTLFLVAILGGSVGTWIGMYTFRHKTKHIQFVVGVPLIFVIQTGLVYLILFAN
ncbi:MAG: DUF1294 domain-containing protein [Lachnospiraceae bacterium]